MYRDYLFKEFVEVDYDNAVRVVGKALVFHGGKSNFNDCLKKTKDKVREITKILVKVRTEHRNLYMEEIGLLENLLSEIVHECTDNWLKVTGAIELKFTSGKIIDGVFSDLEYNYEKALGINK